MPKRQFSTILLTSFLTAFFLFLLFAVGLYFIFPKLLNEKTDTSSPKETTSEPKSRWKLWSSVPASEITKVVFSEWQHQGPLAAPGGSVVSNAVGFSRDGTAFKTKTINYDDGRKEPPTNYKGAISKEQFEKLAQVVAENDFLNEPDSTEIITESQTALTISYAGGEKKIITSNIGKDTLEAAVILRAFRNLESQIDWKEDR
ncbi:MAG: hypothetical protein H0W58_10780 [Acidobacteria bacterium]|nr:hypothetical protein [Acidobacteriota bacterium]